MFLDRTAAYLHWMVSTSNGSSGSRRACIAPIQNDAERKATALSHCRLQSDGRPHQLHQPLSDAQPKSSAAIATVNRGVSLAKHLEYARLLGGLNADPVIAHGEGKAIATLIVTTLTSLGSRSGRRREADRGGAAHLKSERYVTFRARRGHARGELQSVGHKIHQHLHQLPPVYKELHTADVQASAGKTQLQPSLSRLTIKGADQTTYLLAQNDAAHRELHRSAIELTEIQDVVDEGEESVGAASKRLRVLSNLREVLGLTVQLLHNPNNAVERGADLVRHHTQKQGPLFGSLFSIEHLLCSAQVFNT
mmetsp:Transcript_20234/g.51712  ORF Transcript_20234/g.51712 Transcript_20234/m.51712 type:complete len:308 (-) Transcript_20234:1433-2356(-)